MLYSVPCLPQVYPDVLHARHDDHMVECKNVTVPVGYVEAVVVCGCMR